MKLILALLAFIAMLPAAAAEPDRYAAGQVWEYHTRAGDEGSLLKIQRVEDGGPLGTVYHISVIGLTIPGISEAGHLPVSRATLDASVTRRVESDAVFPDDEEGIAIWRADKGGVFTISLAEIFEIFEHQLT